MDAKSKQGLAEVALGFHGLALNGGFPGAFAAMPTTLDRVVEAFTLLHLSDAGRLVSAGVGVVPGSGTANQRTRAGLVEGLSVEAATQLEDLGNRYMELVTDSLVGEQIARYAAPARRLRLPRGVPDMLAEYRTNAIERDGLGVGREVARGNGLFKRNGKLYGYLRETDAGREGIWAMRLDPNPAVRRSAVVHSLPWHSDEAAGLLGEMAAAGGMGGLEAELTLKAWQDGKLNLEW